MAYNSANQYRCDIVRTRAMRKMEDLLPCYAEIIDDICPCSETDFVVDFNARLGAFLGKLGFPVNKKSLDNHRTETAKTLFGMYYIDSAGMVQASERTKNFLKDGDIPAFFKDFCYKLQFPNGMTKDKKLDDRIAKNLKIYPYRFLLEVLQIADTKGMQLNIRELGYYVLNSLDVLQGKATPGEVVRKIKNDQAKGIKNDITVGPNRPYNWEHIEGLINYLYLANLITINGRFRDAHERIVRLNNAENKTIHLFITDRKKVLGFDVSKYIKVLPSGLKKVINKKQFQLDWDKYNGDVSLHYKDFYTLPSMLGITAPKAPIVKANGKTTIIGATGEAYVVDFEENRLNKINPAYVAYVKNRSAERGIGFDIESVEAVGLSPMDKRYIEVKTTSRVSAPNPVSLPDSIVLTRNEMKAANDYPKEFCLYRVYLTRGNVYIYIIRDFVTKEKAGFIDVSAPSYEVKFDAASKSVVDEQIKV